MTPSILLGRKEGLTRVDEFEARHVNETVEQLVGSARSADRARASSAGTLAIAGLTYHLADGTGRFARLRGRHRRRLRGDTPGEVRRLCVTWPYRRFVLETEPHNPLPPEIYRRRRFLALGVGALVLVIVIAVVVVVFANSTGGNSTGTQQSSTRRLRTSALPGENPEVKSPIMPPAQQAPPPTPTPVEAVVPPPVLKEGDDCPDSALAVKGITSQPNYVVGDQPKFTMVVTNIGLVACKRDVGAAVLAAYVYGLDNNRLWSNLDCAPSNETLVKTFNPASR